MDETEYFTWVEDDVTCSDEEDITIQQMPGKSLIIPVQIDAENLSAVVDTAAEITILSSDVADKIHLSYKTVKPIRLRMAGKKSHMLAHKIKDAQISIGGQPFILDIYVAPIADQLLLGFDFLNKNNAIIDFGRASLSIADMTIPDVVHANPSSITAVSRVVVAVSVSIPPNCAKLINVKLLDLEAKENDLFLVEPQNHQVDLLISYALVKGNEHLALNFINTSDKTIKLSKDKDIGEASEVDSILNQVSEQSPSVQQTKESTESTEIPKSAEDRLKDIEISIPEYMRDLF